jgi:hypothetical protein
MAFVYVTEYSQLGMYENTQIPLDPPIADYQVAVGASSASGPAFNKATRFVRLHCDATSPASILIGPLTATVATTNQRMAANQTEYHGVPQNAGYCVLVIQNT